MIFNIKNPLLLVPILVCSFLTIQAQNENSFSLEQAQEYALKNNYQIKSADMDINSAKKKVWETTAIGLPQVTAEAKFQNFIDLPTSLIPASAFNPLAPAGQMAAVQFGTNYNNTASITATQLIFDGSYIVGLQAAKTYKELSINNKKKSEAEIKDLIAQAYHTVLVATKNIDLLQQTYESVESLLAGTKETVKEGMIEEENIDQLNLTLNNLENSVNQSKRQLEISLNLLKFQMGIDLSQTIQLTDQLNTLLENNPPETLTNQQFSFNNHIDYQLVLTSEKLMKLNYRKEKYSFAPSIAAFFNHQQQNMSNNFDAFTGGNYYPATIWGVSVSLPIITSGMRLAKMGQAKIEYEKAINQSKQVEQSLLLRAQTAQSNFNMAYETYKNQKESFELAQKIHDKTVKKYKEGFISSLELAQSENQLLSTEGLYIKSILDLLNAKSALKKALGNN